MSPHLFCLLCRNQFFKKLSARFKLAFREFSSNVAQIWRECCQIIWNQNRVSEFYFLRSFKSYDPSKKEKRCFFNLQRLKECRKQTKNSETQFLRQRNEEFGAMFVLLSRPFSSGAEPILWTMYFWKTQCCHLGYLDTLKQTPLKSRKMLTADKYFRLQQPTGFVTVPVKSSNSAFCLVWTWEGQL